MKTMHRLAALVALALGSTTAATAQEHWTEGPVWNCSFYYVASENWDRYMLYLRRNTLPLQTAARNAGLLLDYKTFVKQPDGTDDWNFAACSQFPSYGAALDFDAEDDAKSRALAGAHWKTQDEEAQRRAAAERFALRTLLGSYTMRQISFRPMP